MNLVRRHVNSIWQEHRWAILFFSLILCVGLRAVSDYGITWDEEYQHDYGVYVHHFMFYDDTYLLEYESRYHGPLFQYVLYQVEHWMLPLNQAEIYRQRHLLTFLFSMVGAIFFYRLLLLVFKSSNWALFGAALLVLSPQILAHSFYNSKDASFMYMFIIAMYTMLRLLRQTGLKQVLLHALACAVLIDMRILGAFVPIITGLLLLPRLVSSKREATRLVPLGLVYIGLLLAGIVAFWPTLWHAPFEELGNAITKMSAYPWDDPIRFRGEFLTPNQLPKYYLPWWMAISTPLFHLALMAIGLYAWLFRSKRYDAHTRWAIVLWLVLPLAVIIGKGAVIYDGWRHVFFVYPALVVLAVAGAKLVVSKMEVHLPTIVLALLLVVPLGSLAVWNVRNHPFQNVYFNALAVNDAWKNYEMDYWGGSYKQALEWLVAHEKEGELSIVVPNKPGYLNHWMLPTSEQQRLRYTNLDSAQYLISNHRYPQEFEPYLEHRYPYEHPVYQIEVDGNVIIGVYWLRD
jgi:hypothetical protein